MYLQYGSYRHANNECTITISREPIRSSRETLLDVRERWDITGILFGNSPAELTAAINAIEAAYSVDGRDIQLYMDDGTPTAHALLSANTRDGVKVARFPSFPRGAGVEYATSRSYSLSLEGIIPVLSAGLLVSFSETISTHGTGGPQWRYLPVLKGAPQRQTTTERSIVRIVQQGRAVRRGYYEPPAPPLLSRQYEHEEQRQINYSAPDSNRNELETTWAYSFETLTPANLRPNRRHIA